MKKQSNLSSLMGYAGGYRILTYLSWILSVMSALLVYMAYHSRHTGSFSRLLTG